MADIAMCQNQECPSRNSCYRFTAPANPYRQTYQGFIVRKGEEKCEAFMDNYPYRIEALNEMVRLNQEMGLYDDTGLHGRGPLGSDEQTERGDK